MGIFMPWRPLFALSGMLIALFACLFLRKAERKVIFGVAACCFFAALLEAGLLAHRPLPAEGTYQVEAVAAEDFTLRENGSCGGYLESVRLVSDETQARENRVYWSFYPDAEMPLPQEGERLSFTARLYAPSGRVNPYGFNSRHYYLTQGVFVCLYGANEYSVDGHPGRGLSSFFYQAQKAAAARLRLLFGEDSALPEAMLIGEKEALPEDTRTAFTKAGAAHILSISGLHVTMLAGALSLLMRRLMSLKKRTGLIAVLLLFYCALLGFSAPVVRASLLFLVLSLGRIRRRPQDLLTALSLAFLLILIVWPFSLLSAGFLLSFSAVLGIILWEKPLEKRLSFLPSRFSVRAACALSASAALGVLIPSVLFFHRFSLLGFLLSPLVCAVFMVLLPLYALTFLLGVIWLPLGRLAAFPAMAATRAVTVAMKGCAALPFAQIRLPSPPAYTLVGIILALAALCRFSGLKKHWKRLLALGAAALSLAFWAVFAVRDVQYILFSMGQADAAIVTDGRDTLLIDAGEYGGDLSEYLLSTGRRADRVVLTHLHADHCMGLQSLLDDNIPIGKIYLPEGAMEQAADERCLVLLEKIRQKGIPIASLHAGDSLTTPRTSLTVLWPRAGKTHPGSNPNLYSLAALLDLDGIKLLTMADVPGTYERYAQADADLLKAAHHGSRDSTQEAFLAAVSPAAVLITGSSTGSMPHAETLSRLADAGTMVYNTKESGALTLTVHAGQGTLTPFLAKEPDSSP